jgi:hypothetical protein
VGHLCWSTTVIDAHHCRISESLSLSLSLSLSHIHRLIIWGQIACFCMVQRLETLLVPLSYTFCFVGWIQNLAFCCGVQHYVASLVSTKTLAKQNIICIFSWMHIYHTLLLKVESFAAPFTSLSKLTTYAGAKPGIFLTFFHLVLICRVKCGGAPVSTGVALIGSVILSPFCVVFVS